ncbi:JmjC domain-containing protein [Nocardia sp. N2S4-5]|uniref:JmjC domain-containing protein n=1 Tax=Nocardia sp. N2S4-5 TaxID=3351565 RepID=UPI0037D194E9
MVQRDINSLESLISPMTRHEFMDAYWGKSSLTLHRRERDYFSSLFSLADMDACLMMAANSSDNVLHIVPALDSGRSATLTPAAGLSKDRFYDAYLSGDTIRLIAAEKFWLPFGRLAINLQNALGMGIGSNLFLTPPGSQAFPAHIDTLDTLVVQLGGSKQWHIWDPIYERPLASQISNQHLAENLEWTEEQLTLREKPVLEAGDVLYLPRGYFHKAIAGDEFSLHLSITFHPLTWVDFFTRAMELAALENPEFRQDLPPGFVADRETQQSMAPIFEFLRAQLGEKLSFDAALRSLLEEQVGARTFPADGHFSVLANLQEIGPDSAVEKRSGLACLVESSDDTTAIRFGPKRVQGPKALSSTLEYIRDHQHFRICDLPDAISSESKLVLVRRLIRDGLLRPS